MKKRQMVYRNMYKFNNCFRRCNPKVEINENKNHT